FRGSQRQVEHASFRERAAVIHDHNDAALRSWIGHAKARYEPEGTVRRGEFRRIIPVATGCAARIVGAVVRGDTGELTGGLGDSNVRCAPSQDCREGCKAGTKLHGHCPSTPSQINPVWRRSVKK